MHAGVKERGRDEKSGAAVAPEIFNDFLKNDLRDVLGLLRITPLSR